VLELLDSGARKIVPSDYTVKRTGAFWEADVSLGREKIATVGKGEGVKFLVRMVDGGKGFLLDPRVNGAIKPFSITAYEGQNAEGKIVLKIRNNLFSHKGNMYIMKNVPEGRLAKDHALGKKYICRLVNFPFKSPDDVDVHTSERLARHRGIKVGEMSGLGIVGHKVQLDEELEDIGVPLSVASYLIYAAG
jgi:hypothetical protein